MDFLKIECKTASAKDTRGEESRHAKENMLCTIVSCKAHFTQQVFENSFQIVFILKYRKKTLYGQVRNDVREIISTLCKCKDVKITAGAVCIDHVHLSVAITPKISISCFMEYLKGKSALMLYDRHLELQNKWNEAF